MKIREIVTRLIKICELKLIAMKIHEIVRNTNFRIRIHTWLVRFINKHCNKKILNISFNNTSWRTRSNLKRILNNETSFEISYERFVLNNYFLLLKGAAFNFYFNKEKLFNSTTKNNYNSRFYIAKIKKF